MVNWLVSSQCIEVKTVLMKATTMIGLSSEFTWPIPDSSQIVLLTDVFFMIVQPAVLDVT
jgi:uncharacterized membrane protein